jgi:hypothetical protein
MNTLRFAAAFAMAGSLFAQVPPTTTGWVPLDSSKPGTPAGIRLDRAGSDANKTTVTIEIHGFYLEPKQGPDGVYHKLTVPGLGSVSMTGAPDLPTARFNVGVITGAKAVRLAALKPNAAPKSFKRHSGLAQSNRRARS